MKKFVSLLLVIMIFFTMSSFSFASDVTLTAKDVSEKSETGVVVDGSIKGWKDGGYVGFKVKMDGVKSISMEVSTVIVDWTNGEAFRIRLDNPKDGEFLGYMLINKNGTNTYKMAVDGTFTGERMLYIVQNYHMQGHVDIKSITLSSEKYTPELVTPVPDEEIIDNYSDTWVATDSLGRKIADFEEAGPVKEGERQVGIFYWPNHQADKSAVIASEAIKKYPEAKTDYDHKIWFTPGNASPGSIYWNEPLFGFYNGEDYWVFRRHAEMLANAGVDAIFFDCTNGDRSFVISSGMCFKAFHDAREAGIDAPKISFYMPMGASSEEKWRMVKSAYLNFYESGEYADLWFMLDGKPMLLANEFEGGLSKADKEDPEDKGLASDIRNFFTVRGSGSRRAEDYLEGDWHWLSPYPQPLRGICDDGRPEFINVGVAINESYETGGVGTEAFSNEYIKGRSYTEAFGEDYRPDATRHGYFMQEQISRALYEDPHFVFITGWNEWHVSRSKELGGKTNVFIDLFDDEGSRDIEPAKGPLGDDYYNLMVDFIRKYKGVRPAPLASGAKTIDITGDVSQWDGVEPEFVSDMGGYERDEYSNKNVETGEMLHYTAKVNNVILRSKVSYDAQNIYFMVKTKDAIKEGENFMHLYINTDRNYQTGWEGYDYAVNIGGVGKVSKFSDKAYTLTEAGTATYIIKDNVMQISVPRSIIGKTADVEMEFKWSDYVNVAGDVLNFYLEGSTAPMGRFNYLYTEIEQKSLTETEKLNLTDCTVMVVGKNEMVANGGKMKVYEPDIRYGTVTENGMLYFPAAALSDILGYGRTKVEWGNVESDMLIVKTHTLENSTDEDATWNGKKIVSTWIYTTAGTNEVFIGGRSAVLTNPVKVINGLCYVPASLLSDCFGYKVTNEGDVWTMTKSGVSAELTAKAAELIR